VSGEDVAIADRDGVRCIYLLLDAAAGRAIREAEDLGFRVIDFRITLARPTAGQRDPVPAGSVRAADPSDLPELEPISAAAHTDSRFFRDDRFDRAAARDLYVKWLRGSVEGSLAEVTLSAIQGQAAVGYITGQATSDPETLSIGLLGVSPSARGRGLGRALIAALLTEAGSRGYRRVEVVTQGSNVPAQRVYQAVGFRTVRTEIWLHRWARFTDASN
jgi:ribosomal protein S18 acetylase RimI-like enzyme